MMIFNLSRGWLFFAVVSGLVFQFFQFFRYETRNMVLDMNKNNPAAAVETAAITGSLPVGTNLLGQNSTEEETQLTHGFALVDVRGALGNGAADDEPLDQPTQLIIADGDPSVEAEFDATTFNYRQPAVPTNYTLPPPRPTNQSAVVIVLSARNNFERRAVIRETWAKNNDNVYFVVGGPVATNQEDKDRSNPLSTSSLLFREQQHFGDIIDTIHQDTYRSLPYKLHYAMRWIMEHCKNANWIVKSDDDQVVRVRLLQYFVLRKMNPHHPLVIGSIAVGGKPHRTGKWAEDPHYTEAEYPPWAFGSAGYVVSRPVAKYVADNDHYYYQGEDAGLGIWLAQSPLQVTWVDSPELRKDEGCQDKLYVIGHDLSIEKIRACWNKIGDTIPERPHIVAFSAGRKDKFQDRINNPN